jgi:hypothetical protein
MHREYLGTLCITLYRICDQADLVALQPTPIRWPQERYTESQLIFI